MSFSASRLLDELNARHWRGALPRYRVVLRERLPSPAWCDGLDGELLGHVAHASRVIVVKARLSADQLRATLLHEMAHVAVHHNLDDPSGWAPLDGDHGPRWCAEMRRLIEAGEACLTADLSHYAGVAGAGWWPGPDDE